MSTKTAVTMQDLDLETAELLPARETLCVSRWQGGSSSSFTQVGYGNTSQSGPLDIAIAPGSFNNFLSLGSGTVL
jgi:hypothetical protein